MNEWVLDVRNVNDPSAGSPTDTLLRLLLPLSDKVYLTSHAQLKEAHGPEGSPDHSNRYERRAVCTKSRDMLSTR